MSPSTRLALAAVALAAAAPASALYKVVGPDGRVTYTDRPPAAADARITSIGPQGRSTPVGDTTLPAELRDVSARFPVTLYSTAECGPCDSARELLRQRGVPYQERRVVTEDDAAALERLVGGRTVPALAVGQQILRGLAPMDWNSYLDAAGYPRESRLPANWQPPPPQPMVQAAQPRPAETPSPSPSTPPVVSPGGGFRF